jgi:hypothetical protein
MIFLWLVSNLAGLVKSGLVRLWDFVPICIKGICTGMHLDVYCILNQLRIHPMACTHQNFLKSSSLFENKLDAKKPKKKNISQPQLVAYFQACN